MNYKPIPLNEEYTAEFDKVSREKWYNMVIKFSDCNIYQTWDFDAFRLSGKKISHLVLKKRDEVVGLAQARIFRIPFFDLGIAYIRWGPLWQFPNKNNELINFRMAIRALRNEYVYKRGLILRIFPILYDNDSQPYLEIMKEEGYIHVHRKNRGRTIIMDINQPLEIIRKKLDQKWRNCLNKAERNNLQIIEGNEENLFKDFINLYRELLQRKKFQETNDIHEFRMIQRKLPSEFKMRVFLCRSDGINSAGGIFSAIGETGLYLFGATNDQGMKNKGSYLIQWKAVQWMKNNGCKYYNLNGIDPLLNPGTYHFKAGISGKNGVEVYYLGCFDCYSGPINSVLANNIDKIIAIIKKIYKSYKMFKPSQ